MRAASSLPGRRRRALLAASWLGSATACQYVFGDFEEAGVADLEVGGRSGTGGDPGVTSCIDGTASCDGSVLYVCSAGFWDYQADCESAERCDATGEGRCLACVDDEFECVDDENSRRCENGDWVDLPVCDDHLKCDDEIEQCAACRLGDGVCVGSVLCLCLENQTEWEAFDCPRGCAEAGFSDRCVDDISVSGGPPEACTGIEP